MSDETLKKPTYEELQAKLALATDALMSIAWFKGGRPAPVSLAREVLARLAVVCTPDTSNKPTPEQIQRFITCATLNLGPESCEPWVDECEKILRSQTEKDRELCPDCSRYSNPNCALCRVTGRAPDVEAQAAKAEQEGFEEGMRESQQVDVQGSLKLKQALREHPFTGVCSNFQCGITWHTRRPEPKCPECGAPPIQTGEDDKDG